MSEKWNIYDIKTRKIFEGRKGSRKKQDRMLGE